MFVTGDVSSSLIPLISDFLELLPKNYLNLWKISVFLPIFSLPENGESVTVPISRNFVAISHIICRLGGMRFGNDS